MTRQTHPTFDWRGDRWRPATARVIERRLRRHRYRLATQLSIDPAEQEARAVPAAYPQPDSRTATERYIAWRHSPPAGHEMISRIDLAIEEIASALRRCWALHRDVNRAGSSAQVRRTLEAVLNEPDLLEARWQTCDPETCGLIEAFYPGGWVAMEKAIDRRRLHQAVESALTALPAKTSHRPQGTQDHARHYLAQALAEIYASYAGENPTRRRRQVDDPENRQLTSQEYGPFSDFVETVFSVVPERLRRSKKGGLKGLDHFLKLSIRHLNHRA